MPRALLLINSEEMGNKKRSMLVLSTGEGKVDLGEPCSIMMKERKMAAILISKMHVMNQCMKTIIEAWVSAR